MSTGMTARRRVGSSLGRPAMAAPSRPGELVRHYMARRPMPCLLRAARSGRARGRTRAGTTGNNNNDNNNNNSNNDSNDNDNNDNDNDNNNNNNNNIITITTIIIIMNILISMICTCTGEPHRRCLSDPEEAPGVRKGGV